MTKLLTPRALRHLSPPEPPVVTDDDKIAGFERERAVLAEAVRLFGPIRNDRERIDEIDAALKRLRNRRKKGAP